MIVFGSNVKSFNLCKIENIFMWIKSRNYLFEVNLERFNLGKI